MSPLKNTQKKAAVKETRTPEEIAIQSAANSNHHVMVPLYNAEHVYFKNPLTGKDHHMSTSSEAFAEMAYELSGKGLGDKIISDLTFFANNYDTKWNNVIQFLNGYFKAKENPL